VASPNQDALNAGSRFDVDRRLDEARTHCDSVVNYPLGNTMNILQKWYCRAGLSILLGSALIALHSDLWIRYKAVGRVMMPAHEFVMGVLGGDPEKGGAVCSVAMACCHYPNIGVPRCGFRSCSVRYLHGVPTKKDTRQRNPMPRMSIYSERHQ